MYIIYIYIYYIMYIFIYYIYIYNYMYTEILCWNSRRQLKKKCTFQGWSKSKGVTQFYKISKSKALFCPEFTRVKVEFLGVLKKKSCWIFMSLGFWPLNIHGM